jgi:hypothetical protein
MMSGCRLRAWMRCASLLLLLFGAAGAVRADPPARVGRLTTIEGSVSFAPAGDNEWTEAQPNRPLTRGDRVWTDRGTRTELQIGSAAIRLDGQTSVDIQALDDDSAQLSVTQGSVYVRVRSLPEGENFEIDTPNLAYRAAYPGDYRIDVDPVQGSTRVTIHSGTGTVYGEAGQTQTLGGGQQITFRGRALVQLTAQESPPQDAFDRWAGERNRREDQSIAARYVPREVVGYQQLDPYGQWRRNEAYGAIWFPQGMPAKWAPYRQGHWDWVAPWGWTWIDDAPWGFAPFHYGRWALVDGQWAWVPGRLSVRPVYAPALVAFVGGSTSDIAWFPLAPGEAWQPPYAASPLYISSVNRNLPVAAPASYAYQRQSEALTTIALPEFQRGRPNAGGWWRLATNLLTSAPIVPPPPLPERALAAARDVKLARKMPQVPPPVRQVAARSPLAPAAPPSEPAALSAPKPAPAAAPVNPISRPPRALTAITPPAAAVSAQPVAPAAAQIAKPAPAPAIQPQQVARSAPPQRARESARLPAPQRVAQAPKPAAAPLARAVAARPSAASRAREQQMARIENARREQAARAEHARRTQLVRHEQADKARRHAQARREEQLQLQRQAQVRRDEQLRREARARADDQLRREMHASHVEQARRVADREARALRDQRLQREEQTRRAVQERDAQAQSDAAWVREQQATSDRARREQQVGEQRQRQRGRPDLRQDAPARQPDVWQRGIPILNSGPTS